MTCPLTLSIASVEDCGRSSSQAPSSLPRSPPSHRKEPSSLCNSMSPKVLEHPDVEPNSGTRECKGEISQSQSAWTFHQHHLLESHCQKGHKRNRGAEGLCAQGVIVLHGQPASAMSAWPLATVRRARWPSNEHVHLLGLHWARTRVFMAPRPIRWQSVGNPAEVVS